MAKSVEHGIRNPKEEAGSDKQEKSVAYGVRSVSDSFERRASEVNSTPAPKRAMATGAKFDSKDPEFKKFR